MGSYTLLEVEEILQETPTAFWVRFYNGTTAWIQKADIAEASTYGVGDRNVALQLIN